MSAAVPLPMELQQRLQSELESGELLLWRAQPVASKFARGGLCLVAFAVPWTAFALFWEIMALKIAFGGNMGDNPMRFIFPIFGLPFVAIGFGMLSAPHWLRRRAAHSVYAVTDRRALLLVAGWFSGHTVRSFPIANLSIVEHRKNDDGSGDLIFQRKEWVDSDGDRRQQEVGFIAVPDVREVEEIIRGLQDAPPPAK
jgi:hypothetical protein